MENLANVQSGKTFRGKEDGPPQERMLKWFEYSHLPPHLQEISGLFFMLANDICNKIASGPERTVALRKLLESKDAAVRARLNPGC